MFCSLYKIKPLKIMWKTITEYMSTKIDQVSKQNKLALNKLKTTINIIRNDNLEILCCIQMSGHLHERTKLNRFLGLSLDELI